MSSKFTYNPKSGYLNGPPEMLITYTKLLTSFINNNTQAESHISPDFVYNWLTAMTDTKSIEISSDNLDDLLNLTGDNTTKGAMLLRAALKKQHWHVAALPFILAHDPNSFNKYVNHLEEYNGITMPISAAANLVNRYLTAHASLKNEIISFSEIFNWKIANVKESIDGVGVLHETAEELLRSFDIPYDENTLVAHSVTDISYIAKYDTINNKYLSNEITSCLDKEENGIHIIEYKFDSEHPTKANQNAFFVICNLFHSLMTKGADKIGNDAKAIKDTTHKVGSRFGQQRKVGKLLESFLDE